MVSRPRIVRGSSSRETRADVSSGETEDPVDPDFAEGTYLRAFPDIAEAVRRGSLASGLAHYRLAGRAEGRLEKPEYRALLESYAGAAPPQIAVDALTISHTGATLMTGWTDDRFDQLVEIALDTRYDSRHEWKAFPRLVRPDVDRTLESAAGHRYGFLLVAAPAGGTAAPMIDPKSVNAPVFLFASGVETQLRREPVVATDSDLRDLALATLPTAALGQSDPAALHEILDQHVGVQIAAINRLIADQAKARRAIERVGPERPRYRGTIVTTLRGPADRMVPWLTLLASGRGAADYEVIVVVTNPDQFEPAMRAARVAEAAIGLGVTLAMVPGGDPAGPGDEAADVARSDRLIFMDQTIFPRDPDWAATHSALVSDAPETQTRLFGGMLYQAGGSLSHGGYYFERTASVVAPPDQAARRIATFRLLKTAHPAPALARDLPPSRPVIGVPAAFLSVHRAWFEQLGGFSRLYSRAAHEDIDLCLRSLKLDAPAWVHPVRMWQLEGRPPPRPEPSRGGIILNDWLLHRLWDSMLVPEWLGPHPALPPAGA